MERVLVLKPSPKVQEELETAITLPKPKVGICWLVLYFGGDLCCECVVKFLSLSTGGCGGQPVQC